MTEPIERWKEEFVKLFPVANNTGYYEQHGFLDHDTNLAWYGFKLAKRSTPVVELPNANHIFFDTKLQEKGFVSAIEYVGEILEEAGINYRIKGE